ncbi:TonB-dependent receptor-like protein [Pseudoduganella flava]|uniref:TonB-dependent receptor n=1 Tax=Pseudoduganella flava TaxID=871742 RepID=A0A562PDK9_9BURK|nr:TonB-dependent receptor [Pseudoduganella flava]QGZ42110.1 TonB-dependent receptor [Pseudoduganella flava]TWI42521.1 TonB-dependent receptor-like protein [Pseudoduganella flava]
MYKQVGMLAASSAALMQYGVAMAQTAPAQDDAAPTVVEVTGQLLGKGEARANSVIDEATIKAQPAGLDPLKLLSRVPGLQVSSSDALTGSFSMRLSMRGLNKEQIGVSVDGIPNGSTLSNGGTMPTRLLDPANLSRVEASQTAGDLGTPSNQALGGYLDFRTRDPSKQRGAEIELSGGNYGYHRGFVRIDTGKSASGTSAYIDYSQSGVRTWPGDESGKNHRRHADLRVLQDLGNGSSVRATVSYNKFSDNDYDAVALRAIAAPFYKATFEGNPDTDGLTDTWTGNPALDQNYRGTRGINSEDVLAHIDWTQRFGETGKFTLKPYIHTQEGNGWFYVPYRQLPADGKVYSAVAPGKAPTATVQECYANQYQRTATGALVPLAAVAFPAGVSAASLKAAGCPAAAKYAMNPQAAWGDREATTRRSDNDINRRGVLGEVAMTFGGNHRVRVGGWYEHIRRAKIRNWFGVTDPAAGSAYEESALYSITQDRHYRSNTAMVYAQDRMMFLDERLELDVGATYQRFRESYASPVEFAGERSLRVSSGLLPKLAALYRISDELEVFASGSKNFSAIPDSVFEGTAAVDARKGIQPETAIAKDIGLRWQRNGYGLGISAYDIDYRDRISIQNGNPNGDIFSRDATTTFANQGGISSRGIEITGRMTGAQYELYANYAFNRARYDADTPFEGIHAGDPVLGAPRHSAFAEAVWRPAQPWRLAVNAKYTGRAAGTYGDVVNTVITGGPATYPREYMPAYTVVGVAVSWRPRLGMTWLRDSEIAFNIDNAFDKRYLGGLGAELTTSNPLTSGRYFLGSPRTFFLTLRSRF